MGLSYFLMGWEVAICPCFRFTESRWEISWSDYFFDINQVEWKPNRKDQTISLMSGWIYFVKGKSNFKWHLGLRSIFSSLKFSLWSRRRMDGDFQAYRGSISLTCQNPSQRVWIQIHGYTWQICTGKILISFWLLSFVFATYSIFSLVSLSPSFLVSESTYVRILFIFRWDSRRNTPTVTFLI